MSFFEVTFLNFLNLLRDKLYDYSRVLFKQVTWFIEKIIWLKRPINDLFECHITGWSEITQKMFQVKRFPLLNSRYHEGYKSMIPTILFCFKFTNFKLLSFFFFFHLQFSFLSIQPLLFHLQFLKLIKNQLIPSIRLHSHRSLLCYQ